MASYVGNPKLFPVGQSETGIDFGVFSIELERTKTTASLTRRSRAQSVGGPFRASHRVTTSIPDVPSMASARITAGKATASAEHSGINRRDGSNGSTVSAGSPLVRGISADTSIDDEKMPLSSPTTSPASGKANRGNKLFHAFSFPAWRASFSRSGSSSTESSAQTVDTAASLSSQPSPPAGEKPLGEDAKVTKNKKLKKHKSFAHLGDEGRGRRPSKQRSDDGRLASPSSSTGPAKTSTMAERPSTLRKAESVQDLSSRRGRRSSGKRETERAAAASTAAAAFIAGCTDSAETSVRQSSPIGGGGGDIDCRSKGAFSFPQEPQQERDVDDKKGARKRAVSFKGMLRRRSNADLAQRPGNRSPPPPMPSLPTNWQQTTASLAATAAAASAHAHTASYKIDTDLTARLYPVDDPWDQSGPSTLALPSPKAHPLTKAADAAGGNEPERFRTPPPPQRWDAFRFPLAPPPPPISVPPRPRQDAGIRVAAPSPTTTTTTTKATDTDTVFLDRLTLPQLDAMSPLKWSGFTPPGSRGGSFAHHGGDGDGDGEDAADEYMNLDSAPSSLSTCESGSSIDEHAGDARPIMSFFPRQSVEDAQHFGIAL
ncbi:uncharacterized protein PFL1_03062 [Pseudozyma flocculosa PF-1]|uniref:Uncharacterized protein n=2 Tax=Pseudozyma flocculosa TaxID=84751 RepID=A0A5C3F3H1_9BASI|nr:uncharacterized protein PFL1_03062 [Pseudozyma flocculosa PF-1]EPQ29307.1 hypothetical protein PFL1_03062 [Pseudozyma flocculosa PF-1]SPO37821.1 uncharacterized protein PSFLO_03298 [Pseudozyma flocculosa]